MLAQPGLGGGELTREGRAAGREGVAGLGHERRGPRVGLGGEGAGEGEAGAGEDGGAAGIAEGEGALSPSWAAWGWPWASSVSPRPVNGNTSGEASGPKRALKMALARV